jgi:hypothetical protein
MNPDKGGKAEKYHKYQLDLMETNSLLTGSLPNINLMFSFPEKDATPESKGGYSHTRIPGCISVPCNFKPAGLRDYV